jgi:hypothetical protein
VLVLVLVEPVLVLVLVEPVSAPGGVLFAGVVLVPPAAGELDAGDAGVEELPLAGVDPDAVACGLTVSDGLTELVGQGAPVAVAVFLPPVALVFAVAEAVELALLVAVAVAVAVVVAVAVAVAVAVVVAVAVSPGPLLVPPLGGLVTWFAGVTFGVTDFVDLADGDGDDDAHTVACALLGAAEVPPLLMPPTAEPSWVPAPFRLGTRLPVLEEVEIPTAEPSWTKAWRSGGTARATPMANTAQAAASAGRSTPYRHSRWCRSWPSAGS